MAKNGNAIIITKNEVPMAYVRSQEPESSADINEVSSPDQGLWKTFISGRREWSINVSWLMFETSQMYQLLEVGQTYGIRCVDRDNTTIWVGGNAILEQCRITMTRGSLVQGSFKFRGTGPLTSNSQ